MKNSDLEILLEAETFADKVIKKIIDYSLKQPKSSRFVVNDVEIFIETGNNEFSAIYFPKEETVKAHIIICGFAIYRTFKNIKTNNREFFNKFPNAISDFHKHIMKTKHILIHEYIHHYDDTHNSKLFNKLVSTRAPIKKNQRKYKEDIFYYNEPTEINAHFFSIMSHLIHLPNRNFLEFKRKFYKKYKDLNKNFKVSMLFKYNKKLLDKRLLSFFKELKEPINSING